MFKYGDRVRVVNVDDFEPNEREVLMGAEGMVYDAGRTYIEVRLDHKVLNHVDFLFLRHELEHVVQS